ncbi:hypothetical protein TBLA_0D05000 [Henningerozyma blattae CBS 6284]|uniref:WHIM1 domain-containing protein n=1 Tax=Henningerozyma blattae (strain ATCC 34711 / CBS 6284 / DSM 70876 / NBRC 10599 / NRRL Y-10934 / UCD 77-7) TaxID=1071380 RepID=I2H3P2_HENB6|nr:hypothetical protein TBLA_0D05000 [Tetrapisispora blattae CBS 6284]CCH60994.1 hypothetical protein TBLA_0D05000 [Tetrapisispora blattae CBS 6284]
MSDQTENFMTIQQNGNNDKDMSSFTEETIDVESDLKKNPMGLRRSSRRSSAKKSIDQEAEEDAAREAAISQARKERLKATKLKKKEEMKAKLKEEKRLKAEKLRKKKQIQKKALDAKNKLKLKAKKEKLEKKLKEDAKKAKETKMLKDATKATKASKTNLKDLNKKVPETPAVNLTSTNWLPNVPLLTSGFKTQNSVPSRLRNPNMKAVLYANDVIKVMAFINKFSNVFDETLKNISFQDFEIGLDLYPEEPYGVVDRATLKQQARLGRKTLYQDVLPIKDVIDSQNKMNLLFLTLLNLLYNSSKSTTYSYTTTKNLVKPEVSLDDLQSSKKVYSKFIDHVRLYAREWGYPKEWRQQLPKGVDILKPESQYFEKDDTNPIECSRTKEVLTPNIYTWRKNEPLSLDNDPLQSPDLNKIGLLALYPLDRIILLRTLVNWCTAYSPLIHYEIHRLTNFKKDPAFGIQTAHVPRYLMDGQDETIKSYQQLCNLVQSKYVERKKSGYLKKQMAAGKRDDLVQKVESLKYLQAEYKDLDKELKNEALLKDYPKWKQIFENDVQGDPLANPYDDEVYKLRSQEFFLARVPYMGDFYLPRLHTYDDNQKLSNVSTYTDLFNLQRILKKFSNGSIDAYGLFENYGKTLSSRFKILYHDTPGMLRDIMNDKIPVGKTYWYEMCHDAKTLLEFLEFLDYKLIVKEKPKNNKNISNVETNTENTEELVNINEDETEDSTLEEKEDPLFNKSPLPREPRFNGTRNKLKIMKDFLSDMYYVLEAFEKLRTEFNDLEVGKRSLRRGQRKNINYNVDDMDIDYEL